MFGIPGEVFWPTVSFGAMVVLVFAGIAVLRLLPSRKSRVVDPAERQALEDLQRRLDELDQLTQRLSELEERVDFGTTHGTAARGPTIGTTQGLDIS